MKAAVAFAFPVFATVAAISQSILRERRNRSPSTYQAGTRFAWTVLLFNVAAAIFFGMYVAFTNPNTTRDALWFMPLLLAPLEYGIRFGPAILGTTAVLALVFMRTHRSVP
jgi:hypothetical protein